MKFLVDAQLPRRFANWLREVGHDALHTLDLPQNNLTPEDDLKRVIGDLRKRATVATRSAWLYVLLVIVASTLAVLATESYSHNGTLYDLYDLTESYHYPNTCETTSSPAAVGGVEQLQLKLKCATKETDRELAALKQTKDRQQELQNAQSSFDLEVKKLSTENKRQEAKLTLSTVASIVARLSSVALGLYLVQVLVGFARYHFHLSIHLSNAVNALVLLGTKETGRTRLLMKALSGSINFGGLPETPVDKIAGSIVELIRKTQKQQ